MKITFENLSKTFGDVKALDSINLEIKDGELFFLLGPSGCGKTTLLRCLGGFETLTSGRVLLDDKDVSQQPPNQRNTAMVFQGYALWPQMTVFENIAFGLEMKKLPKETIAQKVQAVMESVQITPLKNRKPNELSGGQQQRVALARTLVVQPGCLLLDEPLANLDAKLRRDMRSEIRRLCKDNQLTGVYVTHDRQEALSMADRIAVLKEGHIIQTGSPQEIYRHPCNSFVSSFIGETNFMDGTIKSLGEMCVVETQAGLLYAEQPPQDAVVGQKVILSIRPEAISLFAHPNYQGKINILKAQLTRTEYLGEVASHYASTLYGDIELAFLELNPLGNASCDTSVSLFIKAEDINVLKN